QGRSRQNVSEETPPSHHVHARRSCVLSVAHRAPFPAVFLCCRRRLITVPLSSFGLVTDTARPGRGDKTRAVRGKDGPHRGPRPSPAPIPAVLLAPGCGRTSAGSLPVGRTAGGAGPMGLLRPVGG